MEAPDGYVVLIHSGKTGFELEHKELVKCRNCRWAGPDYGCVHPREWGNEEYRNDADPDWFCADGERR